MALDSSDQDATRPVRNVFAFGNRRAYDALEGLFARDSLLDLSRQALGNFEGPQAIRAFCEGWIEVYDEFALTAVELADFGRGVVLTVNRHSGRPAQSTAEVILDNAWVFLCRDGEIVRWTAYNDIDEGRAAAELLAEELA